MKSKYKKFINKELIKFEYEGETFHLKRPTADHKQKIMSCGEDQGKAYKTMSAVVMDSLCDENGNKDFDKLKSEDCEAFQYIDDGLLAKCVEEIVAVVSAGAKEAENFSS